jgi:hypothetical protein
VRKASDYDTECAVLVSHTMAIITLSANVIDNDFSTNVQEAKKLIFIKSPEIINYVW